jgi:hypothetical protein
LVSTSANQQGEACLAPILMTFSTPILDIYRALKF